jgi:hypothetical protein
MTASLANYRILYCMQFVDALHLVDRAVCNLYM